MIVVDLGCHAHDVGEWDSVTPLVERFKPELLWGFDPLVANEGACALGETLVVVRAMAAWLHNGEVGFDVAGTGSKVTGMNDRPVVPCFDLCAWLATLPGEVVLKMDIEGAEIPLARRLRETGMDERLELLLVELHGDELPEVRCPVEEWWI